MAADDAIADADTLVIAGVPHVDAANDHSTAIVAGTLLGRYVAIEEWGRGGMGSVIRAYDPKLQREVALKRLHVSTMTDEARARLIREARAMAQLGHPNVVAVYDVESDEATGVMVVMEYVRGETLREWLRREPRGWPAIVRVFVDAGRGLAAAHAAGLLHRDFKPANVLIAAPAAGEELRVRVTDFGLARPPRSHDDEPRDAPALDESVARRVPDGLTEEVTSKSRVMGTPTYMAPEQLASAPLTVAADQYAFCVALWEALAGRAPFIGRIGELEQAKKQGPPPWPREAKAPRRLVAALRRGLAPDASARWPSMDALLRELQSAARTRQLWHVIVPASIAAGAALGLAWWLSPARERPCTGAAEQLAGVWDGDRRTLAETSLHATDLPYAHATATRIADELDAYAHSWIAAHTDACAATSVRGEQSASVLDLRMACLHDAKLALDAAAGLLEHADAQVLDNADGIVDRLPPLSACSDVLALQRAVKPPPAELVESVEYERGALAHVRALVLAGKHGAAAQTVEAIAARVDAIPYEPLHVELALAKGAVLITASRYQDATVQLQSVLRDAPRGNQWDEAGRAATELASLVGDRLGQPEAGLAYAEIARGLAELTSDPPAAQLDLRSAVASVMVRQGRYNEATAEYEAILAARIAQLGEDAPAVARMRAQLATALYDAGKLVASEAEYRRAIADQERIFGVEHPTVARARNNFAVVLTAQSKYDEAEAELQRALAVRQRVDPDHLEITDTYINLAQVHYAQGRFADSERELELALAVRIERLGERHPDVAAIRNNLTGPLLMQGKSAEAEAALRAALAGWEAAFGPDHPDVAMARGNLAALLTDRGEDTEAVELLRVSLPIWERALGADHPDVARGRATLGRALAHLGEHAEAERELRSALTHQIATYGETNPEVAATRQTLSLALEGQGRQREAFEEARIALDVLTQTLGADHPDIERAREIVEKLRTTR